MLDINKDKAHIETVIKATFECIQEIYDNQTEGSIKVTKSPEHPKSHLLFPKKRSEEIRISEQELRFVFVEQLNKEIVNKEWNVFYSVETPTQYCYNFSTSTDCDKDNTQTNSRSGCIDLVIHNENSERICMIEFKANNPAIKNYNKDFCKLENEEIPLKYFIQIIEKSNNKTCENIIGKLKTCKNKVNKLENKNNQIIYYCYCLKKSKNNL